MRRTLTVDYRGHPGNWEATSISQINKTPKLYEAVVQFVQTVSTWLCPVEMRTQGRCGVPFRSCIACMRTVSQNDQPSTP